MDFTGYMADVSPTFLCSYLSLYLMLIPWLHWVIVLYYILFFPIFITIFYIYIVPFIRKPFTELGPYFSLPCTLHNYSHLAKVGLKCYQIRIQPSVTLMVTAHTPDKKHWRIRPFSWYKSDIQVQIHQLLKCRSLFSEI